MVDLVIRGGTVIDGSGAPGVRADVAIEGHRIAAIGTGLSGARTLDASGCVVAPGFIDIHTHYDAQVFWDPALTPSCFHGVTTVVAGNCGFSIAPTRPAHREVIARTLENVEDMNPASLAAGVPWDFETHPQYLASVGRRGTALNFGAYVGHTAVRLYVMGDAAYERKATDDEVARMCAVVRESMEAGALGLATSFAPTHLGIDGKPVPSRFAELSEFEAMARVLTELGRGVVAVTPGQGFFREIYDFQRRIGVPVTYTALLAIPGFWQMGSKLNDEETAKGADVWPQVSCRKITMQLRMSDPFQFNQAASFAALMGKPRGAAPRRVPRPRVARARAGGARQDRAAAALGLDRGGREREARGTGGPPRRGAGAGARRHALRRDARPLARREPRDALPLHPVERR